jgi:hypothetical protein
VARAEGSLGLIRYESLQASSVLLYRTRVDIEAQTERNAERCKVLVPRLRQPTNSVQRCLMNSICGTQLDSAPCNSLRIHLLIIGEVITPLKFTYDWSMVTRNIKLTDLGPKIGTIRHHR